MEMHSKKPVSPCALGAFILYLRVFVRFRLGNCLIQAIPDELDMIYTHVSFPHLSCIHVPCLITIARVNDVMKFQTCCIQ